MARCSKTKRGEVRFEVSHTHKFFLRPMGHSLSSLRSRPDRRISPLWWSDLLNCGISLHRMWCARLRKTFDDCLTWPKLTGKAHSQRTRNRPNTQLLTQMAGSLVHGSDPSLNIVVFKRAGHCVEFGTRAPSRRLRSMSMSESGKEDLRRFSPTGPMKAGARCNRFATGKPG